MEDFELTILDMHTVFAYYSGRKYKKNYVNLINFALKLASKSYDTKTFHSS